MTFRYPDKPKITLPPQGLPALGGDYFAQLKIDGWRCQIEVVSIDGLCTFTSRQNKALPVSDGVKEQFAAACRKAGLRPGTLLDSEWTDRRPAIREERIVVFDLLQIGDKPLWRTPARERFSRLLQLAEGTGISIVPFDMPMEGPGTGARFVDFFNGFRNGRLASQGNTSDFWRQAAEGIVLKGVDSPYIGSTTKCALNPAWVRCKWRAGEDGMTEVA